MHDLCLYTFNDIIDMEGVIYFLISTSAGRLTVLNMVATVTSWIGVLLLGRTVGAIIWGEQKMDKSYLLLTIPELASKILAAKLLASLPLLIIISSVASLFIFTMFSWKILMLIGYAAIMVMFFFDVFDKTVAAGKRYGGVLIVLIRIVFLASVGILSIRAIEYPALTAHLILLLILVNTALFPVSAYLLENKLDAWE